MRKEISGDTSCFVSLPLKRARPRPAQIEPASIVSKVWNYAHVLKNAGVGYGDYVEQITYLLFLKLADEMTELGFDNPIPGKFGWSVLSSKSGDDLEVHCRHTLENLGKVPGLVGIMLTRSLRSVGLAPGVPRRLSRSARLRKAQNKISPPSLQLRRPGNPSDRLAGFMANFPKNIHFPA